MDDASLLLELPALLLGAATDVSVWKDEAAADGLLHALGGRAMLIVVPHLRNVCIPPPGCGLAPFRALGGMVL